MKRLAACIAVLFLASPAFAIEEYKRVQFHSGAIADGDGATIPVTQYGTLGVDVEITNTATVTFQGRSAGGSFQSLRCLNVSDGAVGATATSSGTFQCPVSGLSEVKMPISSCSSCTVSASGRVTTATIAGLADITASVSGADGAILDGASSTIKATVKDYTNSNPLTTIIVDTNGDPASIGGGTQYNQGTASTTTDTMTMSGATRRDTAAVATGVIDGDRTGLSTDSVGRLRVTAADTTQPVSGTVTVTDGSGALNTIVDSGTITAVTSITNPVTVTDGAGAMNVIVDSSALPTGAATAANQDGIIKDGSGDTTQANVSSGNLHVAVQGTATVSGTVTVTDGSGALNVICDSGCSGGTQYAEDTVHSSGDQVTMAGVVRSDAAAALAADGDRTVLQVDANGYLKVVNINPNLAADNSTLSTSKVPVLPGTVSTAAPTWTNGNQSALSLQTDGSVRAAITNTVTVSDGSGALNVICDSGCSGGTQYNQGTAGTATDTLSMAGAIRKDTAAADAGAIDGDRIVLSTDSVGRLRTTSADTTQPVSGTVSITANSAVNVSQINGVTPLMGAGNTGTGSLRVTVATDQAALNGLGVYVEDAGETAGGNLAMAGTVRRDTAASSAGSTGDNATLNTDATGLLWTRTIDPCSSSAKTFLAINISTATTTEITPSLAGASTNYYVCSLVLVTAAANNIALVDDDSDGCGSVTSGMAGGTTSGSGFNMAANSGMTFGNGMGSVFKTNGTNRVVCLVTSATTQLSGTMTVVAAP